jgi:hypothetical protein
MDNVTVQVTTLSGGLLGLEAPGHIWIDPNAAGRGWSVNGGQMDLSTVVTHEVGHVLGFADQDGGNDIMTTTLAAGVRRLPEAATGTGNWVPAAAVPAAISYETAVFTSGKFGLTRPGAPLPVAAQGETGGGSTPLIVTAAAVVDGAGSGHSPTVVRLDAAVPAPQIAIVAPAPVLIGPSREDFFIRLPAVPLPSTDGGRNVGEAAVPAEVRPPDADPAAAPAPPTAGDDPVDPTPEPAAARGVAWRHAARDACFADASWWDGVAARVMPGSADGAACPVPRWDVVSVATAIAFVLGGYWRADSKESEPRQRRCFAR